MTPTWFEAALLSWAQAILSESEPAIQTIHEEQRAPRPALPYATLRVLSNVLEAFPEYKATDEEVLDEEEEPTSRFVSKTAGQRRGTASVSVYSERADELVRSLELSISDPVRYASILDAGVVVRGSLGVQGSWVSRQIGVEKRAVIDFEVAWTDELSGETFVVETVNLTREGD